MQPKTLLDSSLHEGKAYMQFGNFVEIFIYISHLTTYQFIRHVIHCMLL